MMIQGEVRKTGNSYSVRIPMDIVRKCGIKAGDYIRMEIEERDLCGDCRHGKTCAIRKLLTNGGEPRGEWQETILKKAADGHCPIFEAKE